MYVCNVSSELVANVIAASGVSVSLLLGAAALIVAIVGNKRAERANSIANDANRLAAASNSTAGEAHALAQRIDARATEPHDIEWELGWLDEHHYFLRNEGIDSAHDVRFTIRFPSGALRVSEPTTIAPWADVEIPWEVATDRARLLGEVVTLRITWRSEQGTPYRASLTFAGESVANTARGSG